MSFRSSVFSLHLQILFFSSSHCFRKSEEDSYRLLRMPDASVSLNRIISSGIPHQALMSEPHFKMSFTAPKFEVFYLHILANYFILVLYFSLFFLFSLIQLTLTSLLL